MSSQNFSGNVTFPDTVQCNSLESKAATITVPTGVASTLTTSQSGSIILLGTNTGNCVINIPTAVGNAGLNYTFLATAVGAGTAYTITPAGGNINGMILNIAGVAITRKAGATLATGATANLLTGDRAVLIADGANWSVLASSSGAAAGWV